MDYELLHEEMIYQGQVFNLVTTRRRLPNGKEHTYDLVKHSGAVVIIPIDSDGNILFVQQFRVGAEKVLLELPAGLLEKGESPETAAAREIREEIGMAAGQIKKLGEFYMVPGYSTEKMHAYLATGLFESSLDCDEDEFLEKTAISIDRVYEMVSSGQIEDGKTLAVLLLAQASIR